MAGFGSPGGLGGLGGFGMSYPSRGGNTPNSTGVDYLAPQNEWEADWQRRRAAEIAKAAAATQAASIMPAHTPPAAGFIDLNGDGMADPPGSFRDVTGDGMADPSGWNFTYRGNGGGSGPLFNSPTYAPDFSALDAERERMMAAYDNQARQQQSYNGMLGNGQINGILGPNYADPNFGQVTGSQPQQQAPAGVDMSWADVYQPGDTFTAPRQRPSGWGLW